MQTRPIREIGNSKELRPMGRGGVVRDRRATDRFKCKLPAVLTAAKRDFPIECQEISKTGARISSHVPLPVSIGDHVLVRIRIAAEHFEDCYTVVRISRNQVGPISVHLGLEARSPVGASN